MLLSSLLLLSSLAGAAEVTELAPLYRGDLGFNFDSYTQYDRLVEDDNQVGRRQLRNNQLTLKGEFSFLQGAGVFFEIPRYTERITYSEANQMAFDPNSDSGTMVGSDTLNDRVGGVASGRHGVRSGHARAAPAD